MFRLASLLLLLLLWLLVCPDRLAAKQPASGAKQRRRAFLKWFARVGGRADHITLDQVTADGGAGVVAKADIAAEDLLLTVPMEFVVWENSIRDRIRDIPHPQVKVALRSLNSDDDLMTLFLMYEASRGNASQWFEYLQLLPRPGDVLLPVFFSERELLALQDSYLISAVRTQQDRLNRKYHMIKAALLHLFEHVPAADRPALTSHDNWMYWETIVGSRALIIKGRRYLVPFADMFNYQSQRGERRAHSCVSSCVAMVVVAVVVVVVLLLLLPLRCCGCTAASPVATAVDSGSSYRWWSVVEQRPGAESGGADADRSRGAFPLWAERDVRPSQTRVAGSTTACVTASAEASGAEAGRVRVLLIRCWCYQRRQTERMCPLARACPRSRH
jgi:hypothetical protein